MLCDPEDLRKVFTGDPRVLHAGEGNAILRPVLGHNSVLLLDEDAHMRQRKLLLPPFHGERMQRYGDVMREVAERELGAWPRGRPFQLWPHMQAVTLEVIMRAVFGVEEGAGLDRLRTVLQRTLEWATRPRQMLLLAALGPRRVGDMALFQRALEPVDRELLDLIRVRRDDPSLEERDDILSLLLLARDEADDTPMSDQELRDELMTLLVAGHETTATSLSWALERLVRHPDKLERLRAGDDEYADAVAKEALRLRPVIPAVARKLTQPFEVGGYELPAGVTVTPSIYLVHRRPDVYPDPHAFRPERFLERPAGTYTWIPFGGGVRRCIGATFAIFEMKTVLQAIAARVWLSPADPESERVIRRAITLTPNRGAEVLAA
jgi:cytochrome P450